MKSKTKTYCPSTVTSLFCNDEIYDKEILSTSIPLPRNTKPAASISFQGKVCHSASKVLDNYIADYEKEQSLKLAATLADGWHTPKKQQLLQSPSTLTKEIQLAQQLLSSSYRQSSNNSTSLATDELLAAPSSCPNTTTQERLLSTKHRSLLQESRNLESSRLKLLHLESGHHLSAESLTASSGCSESENSTSTSSSQMCNSSSMKRLRRTLTFTEDDLRQPSSGESDDYDEILPRVGTPLTPSTPFTPHIDSTGTSGPDVTDRVREIEKTWRLVDDLKADLASTTDSTTLQRPHPDRESLIDLIHRLSIAARRKEDALRRTLGGDREAKLVEIFDDGETSDEHSSDAEIKWWHRTNGRSPNVTRDPHTASPSSPVTRHALMTSLGDSDPRRSASLRRRARSAMTRSEPCTPLKRDRNTRNFNEDHLHFLLTDNSSDEQDSTLRNAQGRISAHRPSLSDPDADSTLLTSDNISEALRLIDQRTRDQSRLVHYVTPECSPAARSASLHAGRTPYPHPRGSPTTTEQILSGDRSWELLPRKSRRRPAVLSNGGSARCGVGEGSNSDESTSHISVSLCMEGKPLAVRDFMGECLASTQQPASDDLPSLSGGQQPGSVEALKNMIFTLQGLTSANPHVTSQRGREPVNLSQISGLSEKGDFVKGQSSLQRALYHLDNLKSIAQK